ncbi:MAG: transglycosylase domain-containing protein [Bacteroidota bacterium]
MRLLQLINKELKHHFQTIRKWLKLPKNSGSESSDKAPLLQDKKRLAIFSIIGLFALGIISIISLVALTYFGAFGKIPDQDDLLNIYNFNASEVYFEDGELMGKYFIENRSDINIEEISPYVVHALIANEDARFMEHSGVDLRAAARVIWKSIILGQEESGGGSTISQQLAKNLYPRRRYGIFSMPINKLREMMTAKRLERIYSKDGLLNLYLNTVPFSRNIYGIKVASNQFFSTTPDQLKAEEAAVLIGMLKGTSIYDPYRHPEQATTRRNVVLRQMQRYNYLDKATTDSLIQLPLETKYNKTQKRSKAPYFQEHLKGELEDLLANIRKPNGEVYGLYTDGLKIYTTVHSELQAYAEYAVNKQMSSLQKTFDKHWRGRKPWRNDAILERAVQKSARYQKLQAAGRSATEIDSIFQTPTNIRIFDPAEGEVLKEMSPLDSVKFYISLLHAGFLAAEPQSGKIRAWVGGLDYAYFQYDHVKSRRQVGSTFKPIVYAEAIKQGISPCNYFQNELITYPKWENWQPRNSDGKYGGFYSMAGGLSKSVNTITVEVLFQTGIESVRRLAQDMGVSSRIPEGPSIALGTMEGSLYEMVQVYSTLANRGKKVDLYQVQRIEDANGTILYEHQMTEQPKQIIRPEHADMMTEMLQMVVDSGTARRLRYHHGLGGEIAGKTGTTQKQSDGWFIGYKSNLVAGAWVGAESPIVRFRSLSLGQGARTALPIWGHFMRKVYQDKSFKSIRYAKFEPLSEFALSELDCDPYLSDEILDFELLEEDAERDRLFDDFFHNRPQAFQMEDYEDGVSLEELEQLEKRMEKLRKKEERKEKLKNLWGEKLFGKKKKDSEASAEEDGG